MQGNRSTGEDGLRGRVWTQHFRVGGSPGDLIEKVRKKAEGDIQ